MHRILDIGCESEIKKFHRKISHINLNNTTINASEGGILRK